MHTFRPAIIRRLSDWFRRRPLYAARDEKVRDADRYDAYLALKLQYDGAAWFTARGCSMLPVFAPMERVKIVARPDTVAVGQVVVFNQGAKLTAHRIVGHRKDGKGWIAKGDTLAHFDKPLARSAVIGVVAAVQGWRGRRMLMPDVDAARLSSNLAFRLGGYRQQRPSFLICCWYTLGFWMLFPFRRRQAIHRILTGSQRPFRQ